MKRALILACGNPLRGDDAVALHVAKAFVTGICDEETVVYSQQQWLPEMAEAISESELVIFLDASEELAAGDVCTRTVAPALAVPHPMTHSVSPATLLAMARDLYGKLPKDTYLVSIGGESFELSEQLSERVRHAVPVALDHVKAILSGVSFPDSRARFQQAPS